MIIQVCVGSSCHLKGSPEIIELFGNAIEEHSLGDSITLAGSFCIGKCNRQGVTVQVDDEIHVGVTKETFKEFFNDKVEHLYNSTKKATIIIGLFALLAVVIALMGVFGIVMFETQHRRSEIAIRKVYGAERGQLVGLLNNQYVGLVLAGFAVAAPVAWIIVQRWLEQFANRISMPWWVFIASLFAVLAVTVALVTLRSWRAAGENPAEVVKQ